MSQPQRGVTGPAVVPQLVTETIEKNKPCARKQYRLPEEGKIGASVHVCSQFQLVIGCILHSENNFVVHDSSTGPRAQ